MYYTQHDMHGGTRVHLTSMRLHYKILQVDQLDPFKMTTENSVATRDISRRSIYSTRANQTYDKSNVFSPLNQLYKFLEEVTGGRYPLRIV